MTAAKKMARLGRGLGSKEDRLIAMGAAYSEAAEHLKMNWTDDELERECGNIVSEILEKKAIQYTVQAFKYVERKKKNGNAV